VPTVSTRIAVVSYNTRDLLARCLDALAGEDVWVVDNGSTDGSRQLVRAREGVRLLEPDRNLGYGSAVNLVARQPPATRWLVAANADTAPEPGALAALVAAGEADARAGALAPRLVLPDGTTQHSVHDFPGVRAALAFNAGLSRSPFLPGRWDPAQARRVPWAIAAFLLLRREAFDAVGGFDERQFLFAEDLDLGWRLARAGWATRHVPEAVVLHAAESATGGPDRTERWLRETYAWLERRRGRPVARAVAGLNAAGAAARGKREWARLHARAGLRPR